MSIVNHNSGGSGGGGVGSGILSYPDMEIEVVKPEEDAEFNDVSHGLGKRTEINVKMVVDSEWRVNRYPWYLLEDIGSYMVVTNCKARTTRLMAYLYAKRRGWKISTSVKDARTVWLWRVG